MPGFDQLFTLLQFVAWPATVFIAWWLAHAAQRHLQWPKVSIYALIGLGAGWFDFERLGSEELITAVADAAAALVMFELGFRVNLRWFRNNLWLAMIALTQTVAGIALVVASATMLNEPLMVGLALGALMVMCSPATIVTAIHENRSSGQVTERIVHLAAFSVVASVVLFKLMVGFDSLRVSGDWAALGGDGALVLLGSTAVGLSFGFVTLRLLSALENNPNAVSVYFALAVVLLAALSRALQMSVLIAALAFGLAARHSRTVPSAIKRNFGVLGELAILVLVVVSLAQIPRAGLAQHAKLAVVLLIASLVVKLMVNMLFARLSGTSLRKGALTGLALMPMSAVVLVMLRESGALDQWVRAEVAAVLSIMLIVFEVFAPLATQFALRWAGEAAQQPSAPAPANAGGATTMMLANERERVNGA